MDIYVDGSVDTVKKAGGFAVVTDDKVFVKKYGQAGTRKMVGTTYTESAALLHAMKLASPGDYILTDQGSLTRNIQNLGKVATGYSRIARSHTLLTQIDKAISKLEGVGILYQNSKEAKGKPMDHPAHLVDVAAKFGAGMVSLTQLKKYVGKREVVLL